jgi:Fic family protein
LFYKDFVRILRATRIEESLTRARFWSDHKHLDLSGRQRRVLIKKLEAGPSRFEGRLTQRKYVGMTGVSAATAWRDTEDLLYVMRRKSLPIATFKSLSGISD